MTLVDHRKFLQLALIEAGKCTPTPTAFCVGCVVTVQWPNSSKTPVILSAGYSRELPGNTHAEANALQKARDLPPSVLSAMFATTDPLDVETILSYADVYTTLEPCSVRTSGLVPCIDGLIAAKIKRCFIGVNEPDDFVNCEGARKLADAGIEVVWVKGLEDECLKAARRGHTIP